MHLGTYFVSGPKRWNINRTLNLYPWIVTAYEGEHKQGLYAVAGGHQVVFAGEAAVFDGAHSLCFGSAIDAWEWRFSDGTSARGQRVDKAFAQPGIHGAALWVSDASGRRDVGFCEVKVYPRENPGPLARMVVSARPSRGARPGETVNLRGWIQGDGVPDGLTVDFGDGTPAVACASRQEISHVFRDAGTYAISGRARHTPHPVARQIKVIIGRDCHPAVRRRCGRGSSVLVGCGIR